MGISLNTLKTIAKYAESSGVKSILQTKPIKFSGITFDGLKVLEKDCLNFSKNKDSMPAFLYHLTTPENYNKMLTTGAIKSGKDKLFGDGVFMFELKNLFKNWDNKTEWGGENLKFKLIHHARKQGANLVVLKIPTSNIEKGLRVRSQETLFAHYKNPPRFILDKHLLNGAKATDSNIFKHQSIEYIYPKDINMSFVEKVGEVNIQDLQKAPDYESFMPLKSFFKAIFKGHPEEKVADKLLTS